MSTTTPLRLILIEDDDDDVFLVTRDLERGGFEVDCTRVETAAGLREALGSPEYDLVLSDFSLGGFDGLKALEILQETGLDLPFILVSGAVGEETAVRLMKAGAHDFVPKDGMGRLCPAVRRELTEAASRRERRRMESALRKTAEELARSNRDLEQFAYAISHDLKEPLRSVSNFLQLVQRRSDAGLDDETRDYIRFAVDGAERMRSLIDALLRYSRASRSRAPFERVELESVFEAALNDLHSAIEETPGAITHDPLPAVHGDGSQLLQLFQNLIGNAIKYRGDRPLKLHVSAAWEEPLWRLSFRDTGIGLNPDSAQRIFLPFQRLHTLEEYEGTGIGLAVARRVVELHGGEIWVESQPGEGADFQLTLPPAPPEEGAEGGRPAEAPP